MALFNEQAFWEELRENPNEEKRNTILKYEERFGSLKGMDIRQTRFYRNYLSSFDIPFRVNTPEELEDDFDWDLLCRLVAASFFSEMRLVINEEWLKNPVGQILVDVYIKVKSGDQELEKKLDELWSFQILRLFEIYIEEQMNLLTVHFDDEDEEDDSDGTESDEDGSHPASEDKDNTGSLGEERSERIEKFRQQTESIRAQMDSKNEGYALEQLLDDLQQQCL